MLILVVCFGIAVWVAATVAIDAYQHRPRRKSLADRIEPYSREWVADEAQRWLSERD